MEEGDLAQPCAVTFWTFAVPVFVGNMAMLSVGALTRAAYTNKPPTTRETAATFARFGAFWVAAGLTWIAMNQRNGAKT
jgi:hypothetical protein